MKIALIGLGEVGRVLGEELGRVGADLSAWDIRFSDPDSVPSANARHLGLTASATAAEAIAAADLVISAVTAANDFSAAEEASKVIAFDALFLDLNSASPGQKRDSAAVIHRAGGRYVEAAVMSPIEPRRLASPMLLGGPHAEAFSDLAKALGFTGIEIYAAEIGAASATKMCRSVVIKGIEALLLESMLAARAYHVEDRVVASLSDLLPVGDWPRLARYMISRALEHGARRAEEMREAARTIEEAGITPLMAAATADRQDWAASYRNAKDEPAIAAMIDHIRMTLQP